MMYYLTKVDHTPHGHGYVTQPILAGAIGYATSYVGYGASYIGSTLWFYPQAPIAPGVGGVYLGVNAVMQWGCSFLPNKAAKAMRVFSLFIAAYPTYVITGVNLSFKSIVLINVGGCLTLFTVYLIMKLAFAMFRKYSSPESPIRGSTIGKLNFYDSIENDRIRKWLRGWFPSSYSELPEVRRERTTAHSPHNHNHAHSHYLQGQHHHAHGYEPLVYAADDGHGHFHHHGNGYRPVDGYVSIDPNHGHRSGPMVPMNPDDLVRDGVGGLVDIRPIPPSVGGHGGPLVSNYSDPSSASASSSSSSSSAAPTQYTYDPRLGNPQNRV